MTANVISYRGRSAAREIGKALNLAPDVIERFSSLFANGDFRTHSIWPAQMGTSRLPKQHPRAAAFCFVCINHLRFARHLGQHSGGMIICQGKLDSIRAFGKCVDARRVVAQWDKVRLRRFGNIKVDLLGLGMMSVLQDAIELTHQRGHPSIFAQIPKDDPKTFAMMRRRHDWRIPN